MELAARKPASNGTNSRSAAEAGARPGEGGEGLGEGTPGARREGLKGARGGRARGMVLPFQPLALTFHHVNYYVSMPKVRCRTRLRADRAVSSWPCPLVCFMVSV